MAELKARLRADLTTAMKARDTLTTGVLRMALAAVGTEEVAGRHARELSDDEVLRVLTREVRRRKEAADAFRGAGRAEQADGELAEADVLSRYLPAQLDDAALDDIVAKGRHSTVDGVRVPAVGPCGAGAGLPRTESPARHAVRALSSR
jgi:uncharacterized protein YqeY